MDDEKNFKNKLKEVSVLFQISQALDRSLDLRDVLGQVVGILAGYINIIRGSLSLLDPDSRQLSIEEAFGLSPGQKRRGRYKLGEGITGKVVESGNPIIIPRISEEPGFLDKTASREDAEKRELSFICVPIKLANTTIGALGVDLPALPEIRLQENLRLLSVVASLIARAVKLRQDALQEKKRLQEENFKLKEKLSERFRPGNIIGNSSAMEEVYALIAQVAGSETTILIRGESGTGKELVAQAIHYNSPRAVKPFVKVNCAALPESIIESELFGHERGAFTGALKERKGRFELADGGSLFLDEIGDISPAVQIKLLRVLQEKEFERLGSMNTTKVNVRVITATNRDLAGMIASGNFRSDLYYRLNVFPLNLPPLRERKTDILLLAEHFIRKYGQANGKEIRRISTPAIDMLMSYHWPGNVRELENCIERAIILSVDGVIHGHHLPPSLQTAEASDTRFQGTLKDAMGRFEREMILESLKLARGNMARAARNLGISERIMGLRVKKYSIDTRRYRG